MSKRKPRSQSPFSQLMSDLNALYRQHLGRRAMHAGDVGKKTQQERRIALERALSDLHESGLELRALKNLRTKHIEVILGQWRQRDLQPGTFATYVSHLRTLCRWLGKRHLVWVIDSAMEAQPELVRRHAIAQSDKSEVGAGVTFEQLFSSASKLDQRFACQLTLIKVFGLRAQEAWKLRPHLAAVGDAMHVAWGTKGGRPRALPTKMNHEQQMALEWAKTFANTKAASMIPPDLTVQQWRHRYYRMCRKIGMTRQVLAVTSHSLRHGALLDLYEMVAGFAAPVRGAPVPENAEADRTARQLISEFAGHSRPQVSSAYLGRKKSPKPGRCSYRRKLYFLKTSPALSSGSI